MSIQKKYDIIAPYAACLVESLRAFGYELPTAIADLVDNSITAGAKHLWVNFHWDGANSAITVTDDGEGMSVGQLVAAMRPGSQNPLQERAAHDLGRFGLGLKTASFSQCRRVTVRSKQSGDKHATRCWDLDHIARVNDWQLLHSGDSAAEPFFQRLRKLSHGTTVLWQNLDRLVAGHSTNTDKHQAYFLLRVDGVCRHLGMVFHRLMTGRKSIKLLINDHPIEAWDPFLEGEPATQTLPATNLKICNAIVEVQPFVLPHHSKLSKAAHVMGSGVRGWNAHQGFYVYRNRRLLVPGDWFGFGWAKEEHYKLARIRVDIPNSLDHEWEIDVTKSRATPPTSLRDELRRIGERARVDAKRVYTFRGARLTPKADSARILLWEPVAKHDKTFYRLNRQHPLLQQAMASANNHLAINALLRLIEETVPLPHITIANNETPNSLQGPFEQTPDSQIREVMQQTFLWYVDSGYTPKDAVGKLRSIWPFELFPAILETLAERSSNA